MSFIQSLPSTLGSLGVERSFLPFIVQFMFFSCAFALKKEVYLLFRLLFALFVFSVRGC
jgi:hypothetical protein